MSETSTLHFHGGAGSVTGSNFLLEDPSQKDARFLIDCGLFQGCDFCAEENWKAFPFEPASIPTLIVTHAHIDHIGRIPKLVKDGFRGRIISTEATRALAEPMLLDSMELLEHDARKHGRDVLYSAADVAHAMSLWEGIPYRKPMSLPGKFSLQFLDAGHILGSAMAQFSRAGRSIVFTGDLGGSSPLLSPAEPLTGASYLVIESVYGDRTHEPAEGRRDALKRFVEETAKRGGTLLIPAFSTERTQDVLFEMRSLFLEKKVPSMPVYLDSPLAQKITEAFLAHPAYFSDEMRARIQSGENIFSFPELRFVERTEESRAIGKGKGPKVIIAGSGMSAGGRVLSHEKDLLPDPASTLLIVGYQAAGSLGRRLLEGAKSVEIAKERIPVRCRVESLFTYSAHQDGPHLLAQVETGAKTLEETFVVMGEPASSMFLAQRIRDYLGIKATTPRANDRASLKL